MNITPEIFLQAFRKEHEDIAIRVFSDRKSEGFKGTKYKGPVENFNRLLPELKKHNELNRGIFFVVNYGGDTDSSITRINAQFFECDTLTIEEQLKNIESFKLEPSIIVKTRKSLHVYFLIENGRVEDFRRIQKKLANEFQGDNACINESRVLRIPGFYHCKEEPIMVECIKFNPEIVYSQQQLEKHLKPLDINEEKKESTSISRHRSTQKGIEIVCNKCSFINHCKDQGEKLSEHDWYAMISNLAVFNNGIERIHEYSKNYPTYSKEETNDKIEHFLKSKTGPIKCTTIGEKGYKCGEMGVTCKATSPAALCFQSLSNDELLEIIGELPVFEDGTENMKKALEFINNYLYNEEPAMAEIIIDETIKKHYNIKNSKPLKTHFKKINKEFSKDAKKGSKKFEIPKWYEIQEQGLKFMPGILAEHLKDTVKAFYAAESFYVYKNGVYCEINEDEAANKVRDFMLKECCTMGWIKDARDQWRITILKTLKDINVNPYFINVKNGLYDLNSNSLKPHSEKYLSNIQLNVGYTQDAKCPRFIEFLESVLDKDLIPIIQEMVGYLLIPITQAQKAFVFVGPPRTGKSTLLWVIENLLLGEANVSNIPWQELGDRFKTAELIGKLANIFSDLPSKAIEDAGVFKVLTGEDYLMGEKKNKNPFKFKPFARLVFSCNEIPRNYSDKSMAFYRRLIIIPFTKQIKEADIDPNLKGKLEEEAEGILVWALEGLKRLIENNFRFSENEITEKAKAQYRYENNNVLSFVDEYCYIDEKAVCSSKEIYNKYKEYCIEYGSKPLSQIKFNSEIENNFQDVKKIRDSISKCRAWSGIGVSCYV